MPHDATPPPQADELEEKEDDDPLNSEDDVDDDTDSENVGGDFETADNIVCQWEKVAYTLLTAVW